MSDPPSTNRWCERLGLSTTPRVEDFVARRDARRAIQAIRITTDA